MATLPKKALYKGQALLLVLLVMSVALTVVLSRVSKSVTDISITTYEEDALRAFSAAEAGVEQALLNAVPGTISETIVDFNTNTKYTGRVAASSGGNVFEYPDELASGESATIWFVSHDNNGKLTCASGSTCTVTNDLEFCWGKSSTTDTPAIEVTIFYDTNRSSYGSSNNLSGLLYKRFIFDPNTTRTASNSYQSGGSCSINSKYKFTTSSVFNNLVVKIDNCVNLNPGCLVAAKVRMLYNSSPHPLAIKTQAPSQALPPQGLVIESSGQSGEAVRRVSVFQGYPEIPDMLEGVMFSGGRVVK